MVAVRWYLRYGLSYRDVEELLAERGIEVDHVTVYRWVQRFTPLLADAARFARHSPGDRWFVDETYVKVNGVWRYVYRAVDQHGQVIDVLLSARRDAAAARRFFTRALRTLKVTPSEVVTDAAPVYPAVLDELVPSAWHHVEQYANNPIEADHGQLKRRLRPMRGLQTDRTAQVVIAGHAFVQNLRRGHYELGLDAPPVRDVPPRSPNSPERSEPDGKGFICTLIRQRNRPPVGTLLALLVVPLCYLIGRRSNAPAADPVGIASVVTTGAALAVHTARGPRLRRAGCARRLILVRKRLAGQQRPTERSDAGLRGAWSPALVHGQSQ